MIGYNELYDLLRKEKYSEGLQQLPSSFFKDFREYFEERKTVDLPGENLFSGNAEKTKKQFENSLSIFKELLLKRKKKILNLVFIATETGIMKRDYENMMEVEKEIFDGMVKILENSDKKVSEILKGNEKTSKKMILFNQDSEKLIDHEGKPVGPFKAGELVNVNSNVAEILVSGGKASFVDEN